MPAFCSTMCFAEFLGDLDVLDVVKIFGGVAIRPLSRASSATRCSRLVNTTRAIATLSSDLIISPAFAYSNRNLWTTRAGPLGEQELLEFSVVNCPACRRLRNQFGNAKA